MIFNDFFCYWIQSKKNLLTIICNFLIVLVFLKLQKFKLFTFIINNDAYFEVENDINNMKVKNLREFIFESYYRWTGCTKK